MKIQVKFLLVLLVSTVIISSMSAAAAEDTKARARAERRAVRLAEFNRALGEAQSALSAADSAAKEVLPHISTEGLSTEAVMAAQTAELAARAERLERAKAAVAVALDRKDRAQHAVNAANPYDSDGDDKASKPAGPGVCASAIASARAWAGGHPKTTAVLLGTVAVVGVANLASERVRGAESAALGSVKGLFSR